MLRFCSPCANIQQCQPVCSSSAGLCALQVLTKSLLPLPDKWHGLTDVEKRYRHVKGQSMLMSLLCYLFESLLRCDITRSHVAL
jgi:hypothetical protein